MEEDIKLVENLIKEYKLYGDLDGIAINDMSVYINAIEHLIKAYKELEEENSLLTQQNITYKRNIYDLKNKNIAVSLVEEKIEELKKLKFGVDLVTQSTANLTTICILQELLEKRK